MYVNFIKCMKPHYELQPEVHRAAEYADDVYTTDATTFWKHYFLMGANMESDMSTKAPTISGSELCENGNTITLDIVRGLSGSHTLIGLFEYCNILKIDTRGQITLLN